MRRIIGISLIIIALLIGAAVVYLNSRYSSTTRIFSAYSLLTSSWAKYKRQFINQDGRVLDHSNHDVTTSEGQSYAMLRAVWIDDRPTFDQVWKWTAENMKRSSDNLFGWQWGQNADNKFGFGPNGGDNSASDADSDIALSLLYASKRWGDPHYQSLALPIIQDIWKNETEVVGDKRYLIAGNWAKGGNEIVVNVSYFAPYSWRVFAQADKEHDWLSLINPAYQLLSQGTSQPLDQPMSAGLPPDWISIERSTGNLKPAHAKELTTNYSYDAMRVPWRIALDYQFNQEPQARQYLMNSFNKLDSEYRAQNKLFSGYTHDGRALNQNENPVIYATSLGHFKLTNPQIAKEIYEQKILKLYSNTEDSFNDTLPYYEQNWLWFGTALQEGFLISLWK